MLPPPKGRKDGPRLASPCTKKAHEGPRAASWSSWEGPRGPTSSFFPWGWSTPLRKAFLRPAAWYAQARCVLCKPHMCATCLRDEISPIHKAWGTNPCAGAENGVEKENLQKKCDGPPCCGPTSYGSCEAFWKHVCRCVEGPLAPKATVWCHPLLRRGSASGSLLHGLAKIFPPRGPTSTPLPKVGGPTSTPKTTKSVEGP